MEHYTDKLLEKLFFSSVPSATAATTTADDGDDDDGRPPFSVTLMARNFRRLNARASVIFHARKKLFDVLSWKRPTKTLCIMGIYSFICVYPELLVCLPPCIVLYGIMVPSFVIRHPPPPSPLPSNPIPAEGPPLAAGYLPRPVPELSKEFLANMRNIQNAMDDAVNVYDESVEMLKYTNYVDEIFSTGLFLLVFALSIGLFYFSGYVPWGAVFLIMGWLGIGACHPRSRGLLKPHSKLRKAVAGRGRVLEGLLREFCYKQVVIDEPPETRRVEIYELQKRGMTAKEWQPWLFTSQIYDKLSPERLSHRRIDGARFIDDISPPVGWEFCPQDNPWVLDMHPDVWVNDFNVEGVLLIDHDYKWVYDDEGDKIRGSWRRRRWTRLCQRCKQ